MVAAATDVHARRSAAEWSQCELILGFCDPKKRKKSYSEIDNKKTIKTKVEEMEMDFKAEGVCVWEGVISYVWAGVARNIQIRSARGG